MALLLEAESSQKFYEFYFYKKFHQKNDQVFTYQARFICRKTINSLTTIRLQAWIGQGRISFINITGYYSYQVRDNSSYQLNAGKKGGFVIRCFFIVDIWCRPSRESLSLILFSPQRNKSCWKVGTEDVLLLHCAQI